MATEEYFTLNRLTGGEIVAGIGGISLFVLLFLPWYSIDGVSTNAWGAFSLTDILLGLAALAGIELAVATASLWRSVVPMVIGVMCVMAGAIAALVIILNILNPPAPFTTDQTETAAYLALVASLAVAGGGWWANRREDGLGNYDPNEIGEVRETPAPDAPRSH